jgi:hypothetical protein
MKKVGSWWLTIVAIAVATAGLGCQTNESPASTAAVAPPVPATAAAAEPATPMVVQFTPPPPAYKGELPPLPDSGFAPARPPEVVRAVYTFAARHPEVLHYVPCFCGCERSGHKDNDDCFIRSRDANGRPTWEEHGMT